mmetsp:Transcript_65604/g.184742  ORF Transcript_65604/g.184742 Transcript_65604/m.184742 type:complete len:249 (+) Transcript_65604:91-837(+)
MPGRTMPSPPEELKEWRLVPCFHIAGLFASTLMMMYPFYLLYWVGENTTITGVMNACVLTFGNWRVLHVSHLLLWALVLTFFVLTYPIALVRDEEEAVYVYVLTAGSIPIPFREIKEVRVMRNFCGYIQLVTTAVPIMMKPEIGAERFVSDYMSFHSPATYGATGKEKKQPGAASPGSTATELAEGAERGAKAASGAGVAVAAGAGAADPSGKDATLAASQSVVGGGERGDAGPAPGSAAAAEGAPAA